MQPMVKYIPKTKNIFHYILQNAILFQPILFQSIFTTLLVQKIILIIPTNTPFHHTSVTIYTKNISPNLGIYPVQVVWKDHVLGNLVRTDTV